MAKAKDTTLLHDMETELHDLCQPLTSLSFQLEQAKWAGDRGSLQESVDAAMHETQRMIGAVERMRHRLQREQMVDR